MSTSKADAAGGLLGLLLTYLKGDPRKVSYSWAARPSNETGAQVEEGDKIKLKVFLREKKPMIDPMLADMAYDHTWYPENVCSEFAEGGYWARAVGGDNEWANAIVFTCTKLPGDRFGLSGHVENEQKLWTNHGDWLNFFHDNNITSASMAFVQAGEPNVYEICFQTKHLVPVMSRYRLNVKNSGRICVFKVMRADQPDPAAAKEIVEPTPAGASAGNAASTN